MKIRNRFRAYLVTILFFAFWFLKVKYKVKIFSRCLRKSPSIIKVTHTSVVKCEDARGSRYSLKVLLQNSLYSSVVTSLGLRSCTYQQHDDSVFLKDTSNIDIKMLRLYPYWLGLISKLPVPVLFNNSLSFLLLLLQYTYTSGPIYVQK